jgi:hypothetical protein
LPTAAENCEVELRAWLGFLLDVGHLVQNVPSLATWTSLRFRLSYSLAMARFGSLGFHDLFAG